MKKIFLILISFAVMGSFVSCNDKPIAADNLPSKAKQFMETYFQGIEVMSVIKDNVEYDVTLFDGTEIEFRLSGDWKKVDCHRKPVPEGFFPASIVTYVSTNFPNAFIDEISFENNRYEVGLSNELELYFNSQGAFINVD